MKYSEWKDVLKVGMKIKFLKSANGIWSECEGKDFVVTDKGPPSSNWLFDCKPGPYIRENDELDILTLEDGVTPYQKFKVGDRVRCVGDGEGSCDWQQERDFVIDRITNDVAWPKEGGGVFFKHLELLPEEKETITEDFAVPDLEFYKSQILINQEETLPKDKTMNNTFQAIKAKLKPVDRILVKKGYLNPDGSRTAPYENELWERHEKERKEAALDKEDSEAFRKELSEELMED